MAGRKPKPTNLKLIQGNPGKRKLPEHEPTPDVADPEYPAPEHLSEFAKAHWGAVCRMLSEANVLTVMDLDALAMYCDAYARWVEANEKIRVTGTVVKAPTSGYPMQSPYLSVANKAFEQMRAILTEFGMTPSSRTRVKTVSKAKDDPLDKYLGKKK